MAEVDQADENTVDPLGNMLVRFDRLRVIMPSGLEVAFPDNADLPRALADYIGDLPDLLALV